MTPKERAALVERLNRTPLYEGSGDETSLGDDAAAEITRLAAESDALRVNLARFAITEEYDFPGDVPEFCGWWCVICKEHVELDGSGHYADCVIAGQMPASTPPASQEGQADAG